MKDQINVKEYWNFLAETAAFERGLGRMRGGFDELSFRMCQKIASLEARGIPVGRTSATKIDSLSNTALLNELIIAEKARAANLKRNYATAEDIDEAEDIEDEDFDLGDYEFTGDGIDYASMRDITEISDDEDSFFEADEDDENAIEGACYRFCVNELLVKLPLGSRFSNNIAN